jgi:hypothetical protein
MITRRATNNDVAGILELQEKNLFENLSESEKENGFVTTPFTTLLLQGLLDCHGLFVAESAGRILGYTMAASWDYFSQWPIFPFMMSRLSGFVFNGTSVSDQSSFQYGPICIDSTLRGTDAFPRLFDEMRRELTNRYPIGITFINKLNSRSYAAHTSKLGMLVIDEFEFSGRQYYGLAFETNVRILPKTIG